MQLLIIEGSSLPGFAGQADYQPPRCFCEVWGGPEFMLLLEDLTPAKQGDQLAGCDAGVATAQSRRWWLAPLWRIYLSMTCHF